MQEVPFGEEVMSRMSRALETLGLLLCHLEWKAGARRGVLSLFIDREGGVSLDDCEQASHAVSAVLDELPDVPGPYTLEVSSPGLDRPLWTLEDCRRFAGKRVTVRLAAKVEGTSRLKGVLEEVDGDALTVLDEDRHRRYTVRFGDVKQARLIPEL